MGNTKLRRRRLWLRGVEVNSASHCWLLDVAMSSRMRLLGSNFSASIAILKETPIGRFLARGCSKTDEDFEMSGGGGGWTCWMGSIRKELTVRGNRWELEFRWKLSVPRRLDKEGVVMEASIPRWDLDSISMKLSVDEAEVLNRK